MNEQINIKSTQSQNVIIDTENIYYNDKQDVINDINKIVDEKLTIKFSEIYLELNKIKNDLDEKHETIKKSNNIIIDSLKNELLIEIKTFVTDHIKTFFELFSMSSNSPSKKKNFFSCWSNKK